MPGRMCSKPPSSPPKTELQLQHLEALHRIYDLYVWLAFRMQDAFPDRKPVEAWRAQCSDMIRQGLENLGGTDSPTWWGLLCNTYAFKPWSASCSFAPGTKSCGECAFELCM